MLQLQHQMFSSAFADNVIRAAASGQPLLVAGPINFALKIILLHPAIFDAGAAAIQLALGLLILWPRTTKLGLKSSVAWGLVVWYMGEGLGGLLSGHASLWMGAPGAALVYVILALAVMPNKSKRPAYWLPLVWSAIWIGGAIYQLLPGQNTTGSLSSMINGMTTGAPGWLASLQTHSANWINSKSFSTIAGCSSSLNRLFDTLSRKTT
jgi:hypothetical protein